MGDTFTRVCYDPKPLRKEGDVFHDQFAKILCEKVVDESYFSTSSITRIGEIVEPFSGVTIENRDCGFRTNANGINIIDLDQKGYKLVKVMLERSKKL